MERMTNKILSYLSIGYLAGCIVNFYSFIIRNKIELVTLAQRLSVNELFLVLGKIILLTIPIFLFNKSKNNYFKKYWGATIILLFIDFTIEHIFSKYYQINIELSRTIIFGLLFFLTRYILLIVSKKKIA